MSCNICAAGWSRGDPGKARPTLPTNRLPGPAHESTGENSGNEMLSVEADA